MLWDTQHGEAIFYEVIMSLHHEMSIRKYYSTLFYQYIVLRLLVT